jgi:hypothetical protein
MEKSKKIKFLILLNEIKKIPEFITDKNNSIKKEDIEKINNQIKNIEKELKSDYQIFCLLLNLLISKLRLQLFILKDDIKNKELITIIKKTIKNYKILIQECNYILKYEIS